MATTPTPLPKTLIALIEHNPEKKGHTRVAGFMAAEDEEKAAAWMAQTPGRGYELVPVFSEQALVPADPGGTDGE